VEFPHNFSFVRHFRAQHFFYELRDQRDEIVNWKIFAPTILADNLVEQIAAV
jgi:hypothetical protein